MLSVKLTTGHVFVTLEPLPVMERRLPFEQLESRVLGATVSLRGWNYPHTKNLQALDGGIESRDDWREYHEQWRFLVSGFFAHRWRLREDGIPNREGTLDFINALWSLTEAWVFARRLFGQDDSVDQLGVTLLVDGLTGRRLTASPQYRLPIRVVASDDNEFRREVLLTRAQLVADAEQLALEWSLALFQRMGATGITADVLRDHQVRLIERRF